MIHEVVQIGQYVEASPHSPFAVRRYQQEHRWWEITGPTHATVKATGSPIMIVALEWRNEWVQLFRSERGICYTRDELDVEIVTAF